MKDPIFGKRVTWTHKGRTFVCHEHAGEYTPHVRNPVTGDPALLSHTLDVVTDEGSREVGSAISLMDAHALSRMVRDA